MMTHSAMSSNECTVGYEYHRKSAKLTAMNSTAANAKPSPKSSIDRHTQKQTTKQSCIYTIYGEHQQHLNPMVNIVSLTLTVNGRDSL